MADPEFILLGDALWLDFVNTALGRSPDAPDRLPDLASYHRWAKAEQLTSDADVVPFPRLMGLRRSLTTMASVLADGRPAPASAVEMLNEFLAQSPGYYQLIRAGGRWQIRSTPARPTAACDAIVLSAARGLDTEKRIHQCAADGCSLYFSDDSPTQSRKWCSPEPCGARHRVERRRSQQ